MNDPVIRAELTKGFILVCGVAMVVALVAMVADFVAFMRRGGRSRD